jgi:hypothetical protein
MTLQVAGLLAHQGGWDEALMVAAPIAVVGGLLVVANRRAKQALARKAAEEAGKPGSKAAATSTPRTGGKAGRRG